MEAPEKQGWLRFGIPQLLGAAVLLIALPWVLLTLKNERDIRRAIEAYEPFSLPEFPIRFSRTIKFDSLGFLGNGMRAGFWKWTPGGMELAEGGRAYFADSGGQFVSLVGAGKRRVKDVENFRDVDDRREVKFQWEWTEITPPAKELLSVQPKTATEYEGRAVLTKQSGTWRVEKLETPDFDRPLALLKDTAGEIRR